MRSIDVLATEAAPEKFIGEMLRTIGQHLHASTVNLWLRNQQNDALRLHVAIENAEQVTHKSRPSIGEGPARVETQRFHSGDALYEISGGLRRY
jgi:hypothetical protein